VPARRVFVYFYGDRFKGNPFCPRNEGEWRTLIHACHLTVGLPEQHKLSKRTHELFLPSCTVKKSEQIEIGRPRVF
jgi:hypothetical protein